METIVKYSTWAVHVGAFPGQAGAQQQRALGRRLVVCEHQVQACAVVQPVGREKGQLAHGLRGSHRPCQLLAQAVAGVAREQGRSHVSSVV